MRRYWRRAEVELAAWRALLLLERRLGRPLSPPVDVDLVGELVYGLRWDWDVIPEPPGKVIWAGLVPDERRIVMNERHLETYRRNEGLERFTKAHELGHWVCHVPGVDRAALPGPEAGLPARGPWRLVLDVAEGASEAHRWRERHANWFAAALLMPAPLLLPATRALDLERWPDRYRLRDRFNVSISALNRRLASLGLAPFPAPGPEAGGRGDT